MCFILVGVVQGQDKPSTFAESLQKSSWEISPEIYYFEYEEPGLMEEEGVFYGIFVAYTHRGWVEAPSSESKWMVRAEGRFAYGQVDYDGAFSDGTPLKVDSIDDYTFEGRLLLGPDFLKENSVDTLYFGLGYRYLNDDMSKQHPAGYERESNYLYMPLGIETLNNLKNEWYLGLNAEFDLFLWGQQNSHLSDVGYVDVENEQDSGYGLRVSVRFLKKAEKTDFIIEPFVRYWDIDESDVVLGAMEPANETLEYGIRLIWKF
jgi:hypothetical protein